MNLPSTTYKSSRILKVYTITIVRSENSYLLKRNDLGRPVVVLKDCASHLIDRVAFMRLRSIHNDGEIEPLKDPTEAIWDEF